MLGCQDDPCHPQLNNCLGKVVHAMETVVLNILTPVRMTLCPPRLQLQTSWMGAIFTRKMTFLRAKCLAKVVNTMEKVRFLRENPVHGVGSWSALHEREFFSFVK